MDRGRQTGSRSTSRAPRSRAPRTQRSVERTFSSTPPPNRRKSAGRAPRSSIRPASPGAWRKGLVSFGSLVGAIVVGAGVAWSIHQGYLWLSSTDSLGVETIEVTGLRRAQESEVIELAGVALGDNLVALEVAEIEHRVQRHPWIRSVAVSRRPPGRVRIEVREFDPVVLVALDNLYYADADGEIVKRWAPGETEEMPVVTGLRRTEVEQDDGRVQARLRRAIGFLDDVSAELGAEAPKVAEIHVDAARGLAFSIEGEPTRVEIGHPPWRASLARWREVRRQLERRGVAAQKIMLGGSRRPERVVARVAAAAP
jgi:cell division protein FtsQ